MKKTLLIGALFLAGMGGTYAQVNYGVKAGVNFANLNFSEDVEDLDPSTLTGFQAGIFANAELAENFSVQPELLYSAQGSVLAEEGDNSYKYKLSYLSLPVMARYQFWEGFRLEVGPQLGLLLSAKSVLDTDGGEAEEDVKDQTKSIDFGLAGGASYQLPMGIGVFARYYTGLTDISDGNETDMTTKNNVASAGLTYTF
ncbi:outer membrane protein with beta-barrel domain [Anseongella ginsenosidimutans]|uniref:Outer membrane protein with beta-barrel domain n=1 Tax=Anseongella ginsenosidimutans TaxID=496056 RepID=A0A4R3KP30_9SPHI|nr:porin family protein [Anseongella ginsenosidimutans]QEC52410.1 PorT family protein [Anseongella ginsenosidimutans]TCS85846.1 outer membrane protein with beta-barrel domain [Anseongella ginsenosidimutans]